MLLTLAVRGELSMLLFQFYYYETPSTCKLHWLTRTSVVAGSTGLILYPLPLVILFDLYIVGCKVEIENNSSKADNIDINTDRNTLSPLT